MVIGHKSIPLSRLRLPGTFAKLMAEPRIEKRATSIAAWGIIHEPIVRRSDWKVIDGLDVIAACFRLGREHEIMKVIDCTDAEAVSMRLEANTQRRHDTQEAEQLRDQQWRLFLAEAQAPKKRNKAGSGKKGRPLTDKGRARRALAKRRGVTPETIRREEYRRKEVSKDLFGLLPDEPTIETLGMDLEQKFVGEVNEIQKSLHKVDYVIRRGLAHLQHIRSAKLPFPAELLDRLYAALAEANQSIRASRPASLCPWCRGLGGAQQYCVSCRGNGFVTEAQLEGAPKELLSGDDG